MNQRKPFPWELERGVLPSTWMKNHPLSDAWFSVRQYFYYHPGGVRLAHAYRRKLNGIFVNKHPTLHFGKPLEQNRRLIIERMQRIERAMRLPQYARPDDPRAATAPAGASSGAGV